MSKSIIARLLGEHPIAYHASVAKLLGSVKAAVLLGQLLYWRDKGKDPDGWVWKTREELYDETGLARSEQEQARRLLRSRGLVREQRRGVPPTVHFQVDLDRLMELLQSAGNLPIDRRETRPTSGEEPAQQTAGNPPNIEQQGSTETTQRLPSGADAPEDPEPEANSNGQARGRRSAIKDAIVASCSWSAEHMTADAWGRVEKAAKQLDEAGAEVDDIEAFGIFWRRKHPDAELTPQAISGNWPAFKNGDLMTVGRRR